jgi:hypothetical protein
MDIVMACRAIRHCNDSFVLGVPMRGNYSDVVQAVRVVRAYLELVSGDARPLRDLSLSDYLICTPEGMAQVLPFVLQAESSAAIARARVHLTS